MRSPSPDDICGLCDEFDATQAAADGAEQGMGRCWVRDVSSPLDLHVPWNGSTCVSFRLDRQNLRCRRQFVEVCRRAMTDQEQDPTDGSTESSYETQ
jgi:hypothetical protein